MTLDDNVHEHEYNIDEDHEEEAPSKPQAMTDEEVLEALPGLEDFV